MRKKQQSADTELLHGTERLIDEQHLAGNSIKEKGDIILIPQPSSDPNEPYNWSRARKLNHLIFVQVWTFFIAAAVNYSAPFWANLVEDLNTSYVALNDTVGVFYAFLAGGCLILQPLALKIGRRPVYLLGTLLNLIALIMTALCQNISTLYAINVLSGFGTTPCDSLVELSLTDIFFAHERGTVIGVYILMLYAGSFLAPMAAGYITTGQGWRWCSWYLTIFVGILFVIQIFTMEETLYSRNDIITGLPVKMDSRKPDKEANQQTIALDNSNVAWGGNEEVVQPLKPYRQRLALWTFSSHKTPYVTLLMRPFQSVVFPAVIWAGFVYGISIAWLTLLYTTQSEYFSVAPYNWSANSIGLMNLAPAIGSILGGYFGGPMTDKLVLYLARRNKGIREAEFRLHAYIGPTLTSAAGVWMYGIPPARGEAWAISLIGQGLIGFGLTSGGTISLAYAVDCYPEIAGISMSLILFLRNAIACGFTFAISPWLAHNGDLWTTVYMGILAFLANITYLIFIFWGKTIRKRTSNFYNRLVASGIGD